MKATAADLLTALAVPAIAALGGAAVVYGGFDDSPGGSLIGFLMILGAAVLGLRAALRRS